MRPWNAFGSVFLPLLLLLVASSCTATTSSTALRPLWGARVTRLVTRRTPRATARTGSTIALTTSAAFVGRSASVNSGVSAAGASGFRQFSQRATRLQCKLQKNYSLRAVVGDVYTNNGDGEEVMLPRRVTVRPLVSSLTTIAANTVGEALEGFVGGYILGAFTDCTRRLYLGIKQFSMPATVHPHVLPYPTLTRFSQQSLQFHAHNLNWAFEWAKISAVFATCRTVTKIARHNQEDAWNSVVGSAMAGAILGYQASGRRKFTKLPGSVSRGALLYGGTMLLLHPGIWKQGIQTCMLTNTNTNANKLYGLQDLTGPWYEQFDWIE